MRRKRSIPLAWDLYGPVFFTVVIPNCWRAWSHTEPSSTTGRAPLGVSTASQLRDSPPEPDQSRRPQERSARWPAVGGEEDAAGQLLGLCELKRQRRRRSSDQGDSFTEQDGVDLDLDHVNLVIQLSRELATAAEPDVLARLPLEIRDETSRVSIDSLGQGQGGQGLVGDHVPGHVRIGAVGRPTSSTGRCGQYLMITGELSRPLRELPDSEAIVRLQSDPELRPHPKETSQS